MRGRGRALTEVQVSVTLSVGALIFSLGEIRADGPAVDPGGGPLARTGSGVVPGLELHAA